MAAQAVHLFTCGSGFQGMGLFAITKDRSGANLPKADCPAGRGFEKTIEIAGSEMSQITIDRDAALADRLIAQHNPRRFVRLYQFLPVIWPSVS
jgi:hypothetical protein